MDSSSKGGYRGSFVRRFNCTVASMASMRSAPAAMALTERSAEPLIGFDKLRVLIRRGNRRL